MSLQEEKNWYHRRHCHVLSFFFLNRHFPKYSMNLSESDSVSEKLSSISYKPYMKMLFQESTEKSFKNGPSKPIPEWEETQRAIWELRLVNEAGPNLSWALSRDAFQGLLTPCCFHSCVCYKGFYGSLLKLTIFT